MTTHFRVPVNALADIFLIYYSPTRSPFVVDFTYCGVMSILAGFKVIYYSYRVNC